MSALLHMGTYFVQISISKFKIFWILNCRLRISLQLLPVKMKVILRDGINKRREVYLSLFDSYKFDYSVALCTTHFPGTRKYHEE